MPNHCTNKLIITGSKEHIKQIFNFCFTSQNQTQAIDFNKVIPYPQHQKDLDFYLDTATHTEIGSWQGGWNFAKQFPKHKFNLVDILANKDIEKPKKFLDMTTDKQTEYLALANECWEADECFGWYDWKIKYWGTKWNAYNTVDTVITDGCITTTFDTAWSPPIPIFKAIEKAFPEVTLEAYYIDEGCNFAGTYQDQSQYDYSHGTPDYDNIYFEIYGTNREEDEKNDREEFGEEDEIEN